ERLGRGAVGVARETGDPVTRVAPRRRRRAHRVLVGLRPGDARLRGDLDEFRWKLDAHRRAPQLWTSRSEPAAPPSTWPYVFAVAAKRSPTPPNRAESPSSLPSDSSALATWPLAKLWPIR